MGSLIGGIAAILIIVFISLQGCALPPPLPRKVTVIIEYRTDAGVSVFVKEIEDMKED